MKYQTYLPHFTGFYNSLYESADTEKINGDNSELENELSYENYDFDFESYYNECARAIAGEIETALKDENLVTSIKFEELRSPKEYNFYNDSINVEIEITPDNYENIRKVIQKNLVEFNDYLKENYTSRSGFISHYSNSINDWVEMIDQKTFDKPEHQIGSILNFICCEVLSINESAIYENVTGNVSLDYSYDLDTLTDEQKTELSAKGWL